MTKFGKKLIEEMIPEWREEYIDYNKLKEYISDSKYQIKENDFSHEVPFFRKDTLVDEILINNDNNRDNFFSIPTPNDSLTFNKSKLDLLYKHVNGSILKNFVDKLDSEIKKVYLFYSNIERELYLQINSRLHRRVNYETYSYFEVNKELDNLIKLAHITSSFCKYMNDNMMAIKKILQKFDKNFEKYFGKISMKFLKSKIDKSNSDFNYILNFKIVDEACILIDDMMKELKRIFFSKLSMSIKGKDSIQDKMIENLLKDSEIYEDKKRDYVVNYSNQENVKSEPELRKVKRKIKIKIKEIEKYIKEIDENQFFRAKIKNWDIYIKNDGRIENNPIHVKAAYHRSMMVPTNEEEEIFKRFIKNYEEIPKDELSSENKINVILCLFHTFLYMFIYSSNLSTNSLFLLKFNNLENYTFFSGFLMAMTPLGSLFSLILVVKIFKNSFKKAFIFSFFLFMIGSFIYSYSFDLNIVELTFLGRFIIGLGSVKTLSRKYLLQFIPKNSINDYTYIYTFVSLIGLTLGPLVTYFTTLFLEDIVILNNFTINLCTCTGYISLIVTLIFFLLFLIGFTEPKDESFYMLDGAYLNNKKILSVEENLMIKELDTKLNEINTVNNFSDTNLVQVHIENIKIIQKNNCGYIVKSFLLIFFILLTVRLLNESLLVAFPFYSLKKDYSLDFVSLYLTASLLLGTKA
jgi:MFS family permease